MENNHPEQLIATLQSNIALLEQSLAETERRAKSFEQDWSKLFDQNKTLREENAKLQQSYENLRIQKGGFGFKTLLAIGAGSFFTALLLCFVYLKLKPQPEFTARFEKFRRENQFNYEYQLARGDFDSVNQSLIRMEENADYQLIRPEITFTRKVLGAAKRYCKPEQ